MTVSKVDAPAPKMKMVERRPDFAKLGGAVNDASSRAAALWLSFLTFAAYLTMAVGSVTHTMLFRESPIKLPVLNVDLPLVAFFWIVPILFVLFHFYLLLQITLLVRRASSYDKLLDQLPVQEREEFRNQLDTFLIVQLLFGAREERAGLTAALLRFVALVTLVWVPVLLLIQFQLTFLPYHKFEVTWLHRIAILVDVLLIWFFWFAIKRRDGRIRVPRFVLHPISEFRSAVSYYPRQAVPSMLGSLTVLVVSFLVIAYPGEKHSPAMPGTICNGRSLSECWLRGPIDMVAGKPESFFSNVLVLPNKKLVEDNKDGKPMSLAVRGRDLRGAVLMRSDLRGVDFTGADLSEARLDYAELTKAKFECAFPPGRGNRGASDSKIDWPDDECTMLQNASFFNAKLEEASFQGAHLQGAMLATAILYGANLIDAKLQAAVLSKAQLQGARLNSAVLHGAILVETNLVGASLEGAELQDALLDKAELHLTLLKGASVKGARGIPIFMFSEFPLEPDQGCESVNVEKFKLERDIVIDKMSPEIQAFRNSEGGHESSTAKGSSRNEEETNRNLIDWIALRKMSKMVEKSWTDSTELGLKRQQEAQTQGANKNAAPAHGKTIATTNPAAAYFMTLVCAPGSTPYITRALINNERIMAVGEALPMVTGVLKNPKECEGAAGLELRDFQNLASLTLQATRPQQQPQANQATVPMQPKCSVAQASTSALAAATRSAASIR